MKAGWTRWFVAVLVLAACGLVACGGGDGATQPDPQPTEASLPDAVSSPATIEVPARIATPPPEPGPVEGTGSNYWTRRDEFTDRLNTALFSWSGDTIFSIICLDGELWTSVKGYAVPISNIRDEFSVRWRVDSSQLVAETWEGIDDLQTGHVALTSDVDLYTRARYGASLLIELKGYLSITETFRFDLTGMFDTPVQWNIENCGGY